MGTLAQHGDELERELTPEPVLKPATYSFLLHGGLASAVVLYGVLGGFFHARSWGSQGGGGAIEVSLVNSAIPLPADHTPNENVLSTDTPSEAPTETSKERHAVDETAVPIVGRHHKPQPVTTQRSQIQQTTRTNRAQYGEQAGSSMPRAVDSGPPGPTVVGDGDFGSRFPWYVSQINSKMATSWYKQEVDPRTPRGARVYLLFTIRHDGSPTGIQIDRSSGSITLDRSCLRGVQRVDTFGPLPQGYNQNTLRVSYYCEY